MDFIRPRAVPALIASLAATAALAGPGCASIDGTYRFEGLPPSHEGSTTLAEFAPRAEAQKLYSSRPGSATPPGFMGNGVMRRPPARKALASRVAFAYEAGGARLRYLDDAGRTLVEARLEASGPWRCEGTRLVRRWERMSGLGDEIRTERVEEALERDGAGRLVHREAVTVIEGSGRGQVRETRFDPVR